MATPEPGVPKSIGKDHSGGLYSPSKRRPWSNTFAALRYRNYRLWFFGQSLSLMGTWMQTVAQGWVAYQLTGSQFALGLVSFARSAPSLLFLLPAGAIADLLPRRRLLLATQVTMMVCAFILTGLAATGQLQVWHIAAVALCLGVANSFDSPARQALAVEMVEDRRDLPNAIALNSSIMNLARVVGPSVGGIILAALGAAWCFGLNGLSFLAVISALLLMRLREAPPTRPREPLGAQIKTGLGYILRSAEVRIMVALVGVSSLFGQAYTTLLPVYAADVLHVGETGLGALNAAVGLGALTGSLTVASLSRFRRKGILLTTGNLLFPIALLCFACSHSFPLSLALLAIVGFAFVTQNSTINTLIQAIVPDDLRGRVMSVYALMFFGTTPFGSLQAGAIAQWLGPTAGVSIGASITLAFSLFVLLAVPSLRHFEDPSLCTQTQQALRGG